MVRVYILTIIDYTNDVVRVETVFGDDKMDWEDFIFNAYGLHPDNIHYMVSNPSQFNLQLNIINQ